MEKEPNKSEQNNNADIVTNLSLGISAFEIAMLKQGKLPLEKWSNRPTNETARAILDGKGNQDISGHLKRVARIAEYLAELSKLQIIDPQPKQKT